jgi:hypothetical protein
MKKMITICTLAFLGAKGNAQMKDITLTLQPTASYNWFDKNTAIEDGIMYGGRVGFGFGEAIELRAIFEKSADLKNTVDGLNFFSDDFVTNFSSRSVDIERIGGEFKANIPYGFQYESRFGIVSRWTRPRRYRKLVKRQSKY